MLTTLLLGMSLIVIGAGSVYVLVRIRHDFDNKG